jgi:23S rRNA pseudouridine1911/1915/1917 synthase
MQILFEHPWFLVVNKPVDLLSQAIDGINSVETELIHQLTSLDSDAAKPFVGLPHRLDRVTTGVMVIARNQRSLRRLCNQFATRKVTKKYHAVVENPLLPRECALPHSQKPDPIRWEDCIRKIPDVAKAEVCSPDMEGARMAVMHVRWIKECRLPDLDIPLTWIEVELETGRMHQIRLQCAHHGHPIVGDELYGSRSSWQSGEFRQAPIALHARSIEFFHPQTAERLYFEAPYPPTWDRCIEVV